MTASPTTTTPTGPIDTRQMITVHRFFRREFRLAGGVVAGVAADDQKRARLVADHVELLTRTLHHHHTHEDELIWPKLLDRVPEELAPLVRLMAEQHARVDSVVAEIDELRPRWAVTAGAADRDRLAELLDRLSGHLAEHLDAEEERVLPIIARTLTAQEWHEVGERARASNRKDQMSLVLGMLQYEGDPEAVAAMLAAAPPPVRWIVPKLSRRAFRRHALAVHGTATP
ncbi:hemerythrin domain-containing protein [Trujillonella endophytica]|uniref:Hemerythrin HHE cation binding domain-containing protein n=1 Tax=Trujillonella endophytica TaxID=673521 RepID=A0A1H8SFK7_9ACTN|nr:hemerythrin domain-containing protein [Trujillella endophytica]SEO77442.1 Hemerythrin HHE cation binding domain-containing protein [Trujillella endophytica]